MRHIRNLTLILLMALSSCGKKTTTQRQTPRITVDVRPEATYNKAKDKLFVPVTFTNNTIDKVDLSLYNFFYELFDGEDLLDEGKNSGLSIAMRFKHEYEFIVNENGNVEFTLTVPKTGAQIINKENLRIKLLLKDEQSNLVDTSESLISIVEQKNATKE